MIGYGIEEASDTSASMTRARSDCDVPRYWANNVAAALVALDAMIDRERSEEPDKIEDG